MSFQEKAMPGRLRPRLRCSWRSSICSAARLRGPLERRVRLGNEDRRADFDLRSAAVATPTRFFDGGGEFDDALDVVQRLRRQADHEVQLDVRPAVSEGRLSRGQEVVVGRRLVDDVAQALAAGLGGEGDVAPARARRRGRQPHGEAIDAQAGQGDGQPSRRTGGAGPRPWRPISEWSAVLRESRPSSS